MKSICIIARRRISLRAAKGCRFASTSTVYAIGEGWTGALGTGRLDQKIRGHEDHISDEADMPVEMYSTERNIQSCAVGWGHTALVVDNKLYLTGRPHEFSALLRLQRLPAWLRYYAVRQTYHTTNGIIDRSMNPIDLIGRAVTSLSEMFGSEQDWDSARKQSYLASLTEIPMKEPAAAVSCSAGFSAVTTTSGAVYTFGLNGMGQCGIGYTSNNVWTPSAVVGLSSEFATGKRVDLEQSYPITSAVLGLQRTYIQKRRMRLRKRNCLTHVSCYCVNIGHLNII
jgi:alpha-tubulin suppressor-like RCC1 family protein